MVPAIPCSQEHLQLTRQLSSMPDGPCTALRPHSPTLRGIRLVSALLTYVDVLLHFAGDAAAICSLTALLKVCLL